jgi:hypothetical protein
VSVVTTVPTSTTTRVILAIDSFEMHVSYLEIRPINESTYADK